MATPKTCVSPGVGNSNARRNSPAGPGRVFIRWTELPKDVVQTVQTDRDLNEISLIGFPERPQLSRRGG